MPPDIIDSLECLMFGAIGMTTVALASAAAGELTLPQWRALVVIGRQGQTRVGAIADSVGTSLPSTSRLVRRLERNGLVTTQRDEDDRRATLVGLTPRGLRLRDDVVAKRRRLMDEAIVARSPRLPKALVPGLAALARAFEPYT